MSFDEILDLTAVVFSYQVDGSDFWASEIAGKAKSHCSTKSQRRGRSKSVRYNQTCLVHIGRKAPRPVGDDPINIRGMLYTWQVFYRPIPQIPQTSRNDMRKLLRVPDTRYHTAGVASLVWLVDRSFFHVKSMRTAVRVGKKM